MSNKKKTLHDLLDEALQNARDDRAKASEAYEKMKDSLDMLDRESAMLIGNTAVKLLEQNTRSNEQIVRLAQILEKQESKLAKDDKQPVNLSELLSSFDEDEEKKCH